jgi:hypothetical protein
MIMSTVIDDFSSGIDDVTIKSGLNLKYQSGTMLGGGRSTHLITIFNPQNQPAHLDITNGYLNLSVGAEQYLRLEVTYGVQPDGSGDGINVPLTDSGVGDFSSMGSAFRTNFRFRDNMLINFNIVVYTASGWASYGENLPVPPSAPNHIDFPFERFKTFTQADFSKVTAVFFGFQTLADFVIDSIEII